MGGTAMVVPLLLFLGGFGHGGAESGGAAGMIWSTLPSSCWLPEFLRCLADVRKARTKEEIGHSGRDDKILLR